jgi:CheY-like chemotaxis protein
MPLDRMIVIVDDDADFRALLCEVLESEGYAVTAFATPRAALAGLTPEPPALFLLDALMPDMPGWELATSLQARYQPPVPVLFVTALSRAEVQQHVTPGPGLGVVLEPFELPDLFSAMEDLIEPLVPAEQATERRVLVGAGVP